MAFELLIVTAAVVNSITFKQYSTFVAAQQDRPKNEVTDVTSE
jgi:hypothetical protein